MLVDIILHSKTISKDSWITDRPGPHTTVIVTIKSDHCPRPPTKCPDLAHTHIHTHKAFKSTATRKLEHHEGEAD